MRTVNIHEAKTHLSRLIEEAVSGDSFIIAKAGKPMVKVERIDAAETRPKSRLGFMKGRFRVPEDIKTPYAQEIEALFYGEK
jgi:prevent-host-death family protein